MPECHGRAGVPRSWSPRHGRAMEVGDLVHSNEAFKRLFSTDRYATRPGDGMRIVAGGSSSSVSISSGDSVPPTGG
jgi:hypothetical protein